MANPREYAAPAQSEGPIPAYVVVEHHEPVDATVYRFDEKSRTIQKEEVKKSGGYMVLFPRGHSIFYDDLAALEKAGLGEVVPLINMKHNEAEMNKDNENPLGTVQRKIKA